MGVTISKTNGKNATGTPKSKPLEDFRRVSTRVGKISVMAKESRRKALMKPPVDNINESSSENNTKSVDLDDTSRLGRKKRPSIAQFYDDTDRGHTLVYKDTSDAWAALRDGHVLDAIDDIPETEISVIDSALGGYKTVEKTRGSVVAAHASETEFDSGTGSFLDAVREAAVTEENFVIPFANGVVPERWKEKVLSHSKCSICDAFTGSEVYPCRVCNQVFHEDCLKRRGKINDAEATRALKTAHGNIGWSCYDCENLGSLLSDDDMLELMEVFERCDVDSDATISLEEFIQYRQVVIKDHEDRDITPAEIEDETRQFKSIDSDLTGTLSWWEFLNHEAIRRLATRSKRSLVMLLTPKEVNRLRVTFEAMDTDNDGCVTEYEARRAFKGWFSKFVDDPNDMSPSVQRRVGSEASLRMGAQLASHVQTNTSLMMNADSDRSGDVSWEEYLMEQALYTLAVRPNIGPVNISKKPSFCSYGDVR